MKAHLLFSGCVLGLAAFADGGPVTLEDAQAKIVFFAPSSDQPQQTQSATPVINEINDLPYAPSVGPSRGDARVFWSIQEFKGGMQIFVDVDHESLAAPAGAGGDATFRANWRSSVPMDYYMEASGRDLPAMFFAHFDDVSATLQYVGDGNYHGSIPLVQGPSGPEPGTMAHSGTLDAGVTYTLELGAISYGTQTAAENHADGFIRLNLVPSAQAIPLPAPLGLALAGLAVLPLALRKRSK